MYVTSTKDSASRRLCVVIVRVLHLLHFPACIALSIAWARRGYRREKCTVNVSCTIGMKQHFHAGNGVRYDGRT